MPTELLGFTDLFTNEKPQKIDFYLQGIKKEELIQNAIRYLSFSENPDAYEPKKILFSFFDLGDEDRCLVYADKINKLSKSTGHRYTALSPVCCLRFMEYTLQSNHKKILSLSSGEKRDRCFKAILSLNDDLNNRKKKISDNNPLQRIIGKSLISECYRIRFTSFLLLAQLKKAQIFFEYCEKKMPEHLTIFQNKFGLIHWREYINWICQIYSNSQFTTLEGSKHFIIIDRTSPEYKRAKLFLDCLVLDPESFIPGNDFAALKDFPLIRHGEGYIIVYDQFFIDKLFKSLYFLFNSINDSFKGTNNYIKHFKSSLGINFYEKELAVKLIRSFFDDSHDFWDSSQLTDRGDIDCYVRKGNCHFVFECKDILIKGDIIDRCDTEMFIQQVKERLYISEKGKQKAVRQLVCYIKKMLASECDKPECHPKKGIIYPVIVLDNRIFSIRGVNQLVNLWFRNELKNEGIEAKNIQPVTIITIDILAVLYNKFPIPESSLENLINYYWNLYRTLGDAILSFEEMIELYFINNNREKEIFTSGISLINEEINHRTERNIP